MATGFGPIKKKKTKKITHVKSGIGLSSSLNIVEPGHSAVNEGFLTSRTARVLLAGAGFLADAVRRNDCIAYLLIELAHENNSLKFVQILHNIIYVSTTFLSSTWFFVY